MTIYSYSIPALLAFIATAFGLYFSWRTKIQNLQTRLFSMAVFFCLILHIAELLMLQRPFGSTAYYGLYLAYAVIMPIVALLVHLAISISIDSYRSSRSLLIYIFIYGYALLLEMLLLFTPWLISGVDDFNGYTATRIPGSLYWFYELFLVSGLLTILFLPIVGLNKRHSHTTRNQCKIWVAAATPLVLLVTVIIILLRLEIRWSNATVTAPLLITLLLASIYYVIHNRRIVELNFYFPWSHIRKYKTSFYYRINELIHDLPNFDSVQTLIKRLSETINCPIFVVSQNQLAHAIPSSSNIMADFPRLELNKIDRMLVATEISNTHPKIHSLMKKHQVEAIVPFFPHSNVASIWLLLGESFSQQVYTPQDFKTVEQLFDKMAGLFLDKMLVMDAELESARCRIEELENQYKTVQKRLEELSTPGTTIQIDNSNRILKSLEDYVCEYEKQIIQQALACCHGNQARTARLLVLRPNTLFYKMKRYNLSCKTEK